MLLCKSLVVCKCVTVDLSELTHIFFQLTPGLPFSGSCEVTKSGLSSGLLVDWLEHLDPEVTSVCPDLQQKLLFALTKVRSCSFLPVRLEWVFAWC